ncbi:hypothetical protein PanWU01x14_293710 [Parasponia andersonii]|uniref:Uncharacterized protein n=1 Tax=Parasponia andersonii TaxID=3476 RepID=A0A2P5AWE9_PARAD|nr:hypothetical protein PanWU01x14_293710 [Parasponia andersonii]
MATIEVALNDVSGGRELLWPELSHIRCLRLPSRANPIFSNPLPNYRSSPLADLGGLAAKTTKCKLTLERDPHVPISAS